jgi:hypothetical protein
MPEPDSSSRWNHEVLERKLAFDFASMSCTVADSASDSVDPQAVEEWDADLGDLERAGWTKDEYVRRGLAAFDIRRNDDGDWEARPKERYWRRSIDRVKRALEGQMTRPSDRDDYKKLTGEDYDTASARGIGVLDRLPPPSWESMADISPIVELAYQEHLEKLEERL